MNFETKILKAMGGLTESNCNGEVKEKLCQNIADVLNEYVPLKNMEEPDCSILEQLKRDGIAQLHDIQLSSTQLGEIVDHFKKIPVYNGHVAAHSDGQRCHLGEGAENYKFGSYALQDMISAPHLLELALNPKLLALATHYLGCAPTIYSINTWWSFPYTDADIGVAQDYHRDIDDFKFLALFIYLTDVKGGEKGGQHRFVAKTHDDQHLLKLLDNDQTLANEFLLPNLENFGYGQAERYESLFGDCMRDITGKAGSVFLADTYAFHRGIPPLSSNRLVCWIRYGLRKNVTYGNDRLEPLDWNLVKERVPKTRLNRYMPEI